MSTPSAEEVTYFGYLVGGNYVFVVICTVILVDYFVTLPSEVALIWPGRWRAGKILFLVTRYGTLCRLPVGLITWLPNLARMTDQTCSGLYIFDLAVLSTVTVYSATATLLFCICALLDLKKRHVAILMSLYVGFAICSFVLLGLFSSTTKLFVPPYSSITPCDIKVFQPHFTRVSAYLIIARELIMITLGLYTMYKRYRFHDSSLIRLIRRDAVGYYFVVFVLGVVNAIYQSPGLSDNYAIVPAMRMITYAILPNRILINIKAMGAQDAKTGQTVASSILFASEKTGMISEDDSGGQIASESRPYRTSRGSNTISLR